MTRPSYCYDCGTRASCPRCRVKKEQERPLESPLPAATVPAPTATAAKPHSEPQRPRRPSFRASVLADLERTQASDGPPTANPHRAPTHTPLPDTLSLSELAERFGVNYQTARAWRTRGVLPEPDWWDGAYPRWSTTTADEWWRLRQLRQGGRLSYRRPAAG